jgi:hypothetical protein
MCRLFTIHISTEECVDCLPYTFQLNNVPTACHTHFNRTTKNVPIACHTHFNQRMCRPLAIHISIKECADCLPYTFQPNHEECADCLPYTFQPKNVPIACHTHFNRRMCRPLAIATSEPNNRTQSCQPKPPPISVSRKELRK